MVAIQFAFSDYRERMRQADILIEDVRRLKGEAEGFLHDAKKDADDLVVKSLNVSLDLIHGFLKIWGS